MMHTTNRQDTVSPNKAVQQHCILSLCHSDLHYQPLPETDHTLLSTHTQTSRQFSPSLCQQHSSKTILTVPLPRHDTGLAETPMQHTSEHTQTCWHMITKQRLAVLFMHPDVSAPMSHSAYPCMPPAQSALDVPHTHCQQWRLCCRLAGCGSEVGKHHQACPPHQPDWHRLLLLTRPRVCWQHNVKNNDAPVSNHTGNAALNPLLFQR